MSYRDLTFGTAGIRGLMGEAAGALNPTAIAAISHSLGRVFAEDFKSGNVVICCDSRHCGKEFATLAGEILAGYGFSVYLAAEPAPTPFLSYAVKAMAAIGGVNITASHNPKEYNGYKAYGEDGAQIDVAFAQRVQRELKKMELPENFSKGKTKPIPPKVYEDYLSALAENLKLSATDFGDFSAVYTPLCGAAGAFMADLAEKTSLPLSYVEKQMAPNGDFPGLPKPNPDDAAVFEEAVTIGTAPLLLANDPDGDRLGAMVRTEDGYRLLSGNEIGILLLYYLLETTEDLQDKYLVKSLVSTVFAERLAAAYGVATKNVLVGFRYIAQKIAEDEKNFLFGFEESGGYLAHPHAADKDGIEAACLLLKAGAYFGQQGKNLVGVLEELYEKYGQVTNVTVTLDMPLEESKQKMTALRQNSPKDFGGEEICAFTDYAARSDELKSNLISFATATTEILLRPSGTEPKMKVYCTLTPQSGDIEKKINDFFRV